MVFNAIDPGNAFFSFAVTELGEAVLAGATRSIVKTPVERALLGAVTTAITTTVGRVGPKDATAKGELLDALRAKRRQLADRKAFPDLPALVDTWVNAVDASTTEPGLLAALGVDKTMLARTLYAEITSEVLRNSGQGGPLQPLAMHASFQQAFGLSQSTLAELRTIRTMLEEVRLGQERQAGREERFGPAAGARTLIEDRAATFVGRQHIREKVDEVIGSPAFPSGYVLITGEPGIGKTALISSLIAERKYLYHLNNRRQGVTSVQAFTGAVCGQLAKRYGVQAPPTPDSPALSTLVREVAQHASPQAPLVIAIDALDESDPAPAGANRLLLPEVLPAYVYFLVTSRPLPDYQLSVEHLKIINIDDDDPRNIQDIKAYIKREMEGPFAADFMQRIDAWEVTQREFTDILAGKSRGNFMYIVHMLLSVRLYRLTRTATNDIRQLPNGLLGYYKSHWEVMADRWPPALWDKHQAAVRCMAAIKTPVSPAMLVEMAGEENLPGVDEDLAWAIFTEWREFFNSERDWDHDNAELYYVYHDTFREFLDSRETLKPLEQSLRRRRNAMRRQILGDLD